MHIFSDVIGTLYNGGIMREEMKDVWKYNVVSRHVLVYLVITCMGKRLELCHDTCAIHSEGCLMVQFLLLITGSILLLLILNVDQVLHVDFDVTVSRILRLFCYHWL